MAVREEQLTADELGDLRAALDRLTAARGAVEFVSERLAQRYRLAENDEILPTGVIRRVASMPAADPAGVAVGRDNADGHRPPAAAAVPLREGG